MGKYIKWWEKFYVTDLFSKGAVFGAIEVDKEVCIGCGLCVKVCPGDVLMLDENKKPAPNAAIADLTGGDQACASCGACQAICPQEAITITKAMYLSGKFKSLRRGPVSKPRLFTEKEMKEIGLG